jgi:exodeoxyribonuclease-3
MYIRHLSTMRIVTWNVNSVRARLDRLLAFLERAAPDVVCLQELKVPDAEFPADAVRAAGYHAAVHGQRTYNGVAILSRHEPAAVQTGLGEAMADDQARVISAMVDGVRVVSAYVPNGQVVGSDKWDYKLAWLDALRRWLEALPSGPMILCGDFNVAPDDRDVARPEEWRDSVLCHDNGRRALQAVLSLGLVDTVRLHHEGPGPFSWWDYRMLAFPKGNGLRIDHVFATPDLAARCAAAGVDRDERKGKLPSDHAPVIVDFTD